MSRRTPESLLISAIVNFGDANLAKGFGVRPEHFHGYREHYQWILNYSLQYGRCPAVAELVMHFPDFPHDTDQTDGHWPSHEVKRNHAKKDIRERILAASIELQRDNVEDAYGVFEDLRLDVVASKPVDALVDHKFMDDYFDTHEKRVAVPWASLQRRTNGIGPGELWYFGARQGQGKSSILIDTAVQAAMDGHRVVVYSMEMTKRQIQVRAHAALGKRLGIPVDANAMLHRRFDPIAYKQLIGAIEEQVPGVIDIHEVSMGMVTPAVVETRADDYQLSLVDYVGLMRSNDGTPAIKDYRIIAEISNGLKAIALGHNTSIMAASQINREGISTSWRPPALHTLAQSDHLGNDGDVVVTMKRYGLGASVHSLEKNRHGESEVVYFTKYDANHGDFAEITRDAADDIKEMTSDERG